MNRCAGIAILFLFFVNTTGYAQVEVSDIRSVQTEQLKVGARLAVPEIWFDLSRYKMVVRPQTSNVSDVPGAPYNGVDSLKVVYRFLKFYPSLKVEIGVHTDCRGSDKYSVRLSSRRAEALADSLVNWGIRRERISSKGYEKNEPIIPCEDIESMKGKQEQEAAHHRNRRVELKILVTNYIAPEFDYEGCNGQRNIRHGDHLIYGDQFKSPFPPIFTRSTIELERLFDVMETCKDCAYEMVYPESLLKKGSWKIEQLRTLIYLEKMNKDKCRVTTSTDVEEGMVLVKVLEEPYDEPFLMFEGQREGRSIFKDDTLKTGDQFIINVTYDYDKADIRPKSKLMLNWLGEKLMALDTFNVIIESHTDCRGNDYYNNHLSLRRSQSVTKYLIHHFGFSEQSINPKGMGELDPLSELSCKEISQLSSQDEQEKIHQMNRRTVVKVTFAK